MDNYIYILETSYKHDLKVESIFPCALCLRIQEKGTFDF